MASTLNASRARKVAQLRFLPANAKETSNSSEPSPKCDTCTTNRVVMPLARAGAYIPDTLNASRPRRGRISKGCGHAGR
jgi:hypothetical protein